MLIRAFAQPYEHPILTMQTADGTGLVFGLARTLLTPPEPAKALMHVDAAAPYKIQMS